MSKNAWLKASRDQHRINNPASAGFFLFSLAALSSPAFMTFFRGSLEALCKTQRIKSGHQRHPTLPFGWSGSKPKTAKLSASRTLTSDALGR
jgi:hypothetical protein